MRRPRRGCPMGASAAASAAAAPCPGSVCVPVSWLALVSRDRPAPGRARPGRSLHVDDGARAAGLLGHAILAHAVLGHAAFGHAILRHPSFDIRPSTSVLRHSVLGHAALGHAILRHAVLDIASLAMPSFFMPSLPMASLDMPLFCMPSLLMSSAACAATAPKARHRENAAVVRVFMMISFNGDECGRKERDPPSCRRTSCSPGPPSSRPGRCW